MKNEWEWAETTVTIDAHNRYIIRSYESDTGVISVTIMDGTHKTHHTIALTDPIRWAGTLQDVQDELLYRHDKALTQPHSTCARTGPTNQELLDYPALRHAWNEYLIIRRLVGV